MHLRLHQQAENDLTTPHEVGNQSCSDRLMFSGVVENITPRFCGTPYSLQRLDRYLGMVDSVPSRRESGGRGAVTRD